MPPKKKKTSPTEFRTKGMQKMYDLLKVQLDGPSGIRSKDQDRVTAVTGPEGSGKSNLALWLYHIYYENLLGKPITEDSIVNFTDNLEDFIQALSGSSKYDMVVHDEAISDLYSRNAMSETNKKINQAYQIIRGLNLYTKWVLPTVLDLDTNFRKRRLHVLYYVLKQGSVAYWGREKLNELIPAMERAKQNNSNPNPLKMKDANGIPIKPTGYINFPKYEGPLLKPYLERKQSKMKKAIKTLVGDENKDKDNLIHVDKVKKYTAARDALNKHNNVKQYAAKYLKITPKTLNNWLELLDGVGSSSVE